MSRERGRGGEGERERERERGRGRGGEGERERGREGEGEGEGGSNQSKVVKGCYGMRKVTKPMTLGVLVIARLPLTTCLMYVGKECAMNMQLVSGQH